MGRSVEARLPPALSASVSDSKSMVRATVTLGASCSARLAWQFTRQFGARLIGQEAGATQLGARSREALGSVLLTWLSVPGTAVYAGWTETVDLLRPRTVERTVFLKLSASIRT